MAEPLVLPPMDTDLLMVYSDGELKLTEAQFNQV